MSEILLLIRFVIDWVFPFIGLINFLVMLQSYIIGNNRKKINKLKIEIENQNAIIANIAQNQKYLIKLLKRKN